MRINKGCIVLEAAEEGHDEYVLLIANQKYIKGGAKYQIWDFRHSDEDEYSSVAEVCNSRQFISFRKHTKDEIVSHLNFPYKERANGIYWDLNNGIVFEGSDCFSEENLSYAWSYRAMRQYFREVKEFYLGIDINSTPLLIKRVPQNLRPTAMDILEEIENKKGLK